MSDIRQFVGEGKVDEDNARRQAEWERVRKPSDPVEAPAEVFDNRTLYDKLKEQHEIKKKDFEDQHALKNQIRGIDSEEAQFLTEVDDAKLRLEKIKKDEEKKELSEYKKALEDEKKGLHQASMPKVHVTVIKKKSQAELLAKVVKRKNNSDSDDEPPQEPKKTMKLTVNPIIAILPGVGEYDSNSSSSSDYSTDDEIDASAGCKTSDHVKDDIFTGHGAN